MIREEPKAVVPDGYEEDFLKAFLTFKFQLVYCPRRKKLVMIHEKAESDHGSELDKIKDKSFLGRYIIISSLNFIIDL